MQRQKSPVEAAVPHQARHPSPPEQLAGELPAAPAGDGCVRGDAGSGPGAAALGHAGGHGCAVGVCGHGCAIRHMCEQTCTQAGVPVTGVCVYVLMGR